MLLTLFSTHIKVALQSTIILQTLCLIILKGNPTPNGRILGERKTLKAVISSSAEAETCGTFSNAQNIIQLQIILETFYLHQQPTNGPPPVTANIISQGILTCFVKPRKSKTWDMR